VATVTLTLDELDRLVRAEVDAAMADDAADATNVIVTATSGSFTAGQVRLSIAYLNANPSVA